MLLIDDDPVVTTVFKAHLNGSFPNALVEAINQPQAVPGFDVYFVDNDFDGEHLACDLITEIRQVEPQALIVALSSTVNLDTLQKLMNLGCNAIYSKRDPQASADARSVISNYLAILEKQNATSQSRGAFSSTVASLFELLGEWNRRLSIDLSKDASSNR